MRVDLEILDVALEFPGFVNRENVSESRMFVEWISIDVVRWFAAGEQEDRSCIGVRGIGQS